jgi:hypothetical protein
MLCFLGQLSDPDISQVFLPEHFDPLMSLFANHFPSVEAAIEVCVSSCLWSYGCIALSRFTSLNDPPKSFRIPNSNPLARLKVIHYHPGMYLDFHL